MNEFKAALENREEVLAEVFTQLSDNPVWCMDFYSHYEEEAKRYITLCGRMIRDDYILPYESNEDKLGKPVNK